MRESDQSAFALNIAGYQFPDLVDDAWDSNWLLVDISVVKDGRAWHSPDPCMLTSEVERLARWPEAVASGEEEDADLHFLEPNLRFRLLKRDKERLSLRVYFELEARPLWASADSAPLEDFWIDLECAPDQLHLAASDLRGQLRRFPERGSIGM